MTFAVSSEEPFVSGIPSIQTTGKEVGKLNEKKVSIVPLDEKSRKAAEKALDQTIECFECISSDDAPMNPEGLQEDFYLAESRFSLLKKSYKTKLLELADKKGVKSKFLEKHRTAMDDALAFLVDVQAQVDQCSGIKRQVEERLPDCLYLKGNIGNLSKIILESGDEVHKAIKKWRKDLGIQEIKELKANLNDGKSSLDYLCKRSNQLTSSEEISMTVVAINALTLTLSNDEEVLNRKIEALKEAGSENSFSVGLIQDNLLSRIESRVSNALAEMQELDKPYVYVTRAELLALEDLFISMVSA